MAIIRGSERDESYKKVASLVGNTTLYKIHNIEIPNGCQIFCKEEYSNPTGSHYDRFWVDYLKKLENEEVISITDTLIEASTGSSGASFAWVCQALGFKDYHVVIPEDMPNARIQQIKDFGATIKKSPAGEYVIGLIKTFRQYSKEVERLKKIRPKLPNHSRNGKETALLAFGEIGNESFKQLLEQEGKKKFDYFVTALGNGLSTVGIGEILKEKYHNIKLIGVEAAESPTIYLKKYPDVKNPNTRGKKHGLIGTSPGGDPTVFPIMNNYSECLDDVKLIGEDMWKPAKKLLEKYEGKMVGHTSAASFEIAMQIAKEQANKNILVIFYDPAWKYMEVKPSRIK